MTAPAPLPQRRGNRMFQMRLPVFMVAVAGSSLVLWAARFYWANRDVATSWANQQMVALATANANARWIAADQLGNATREHAARVTPSVVQGTRDPDAPVRRAAVRSLANLLVTQFPGGSTELPADHELVTSAIIRLLKDPDAKVRIEAIRSLATLERNVSTFTTGPPGARINRAISLGANLEPAVPAIVALLNDPDADVATEMLRGLEWQFSARIKPLLPALAARARQSDPEAQPQAIATYAAALSTLQQPGLDLLAILDEARSPAIRAAVLQGLRTNAMGIMGRWAWVDAAEMAPGLARLAVEGDPAERPLLIEALYGMGIVPPSVVPTLIAGLASDDPETQDLSARGLLVARPAATESLPALLRLAQIQAKSVWPLSAADAILAIDPASPEAIALIPLLTVRAKTPSDTGAQVHAVDSLGKLGPPASPAVPGLVEILRRDGQSFEDEQLRDLTLVTLAKIGEGARPALPQLSAMARAGLLNNSPRIDEALAIFTIAPDSDEAADYLMQLTRLVFRNPNIRSIQAHPASRRIAPLARTTLGRLRELEHTSDPNTRYMARRALEAMEPLIQE